jgi:hypothetical protein
MQGAQTVERDVGTRLRPLDQGTGHGTRRKQSAPPRVGRWRYSDSRIDVNLGSSAGVGRAPSGQHVSDLSEAHGRGDQRTRIDRPRRVRVRADPKTRRRSAGWRSAPPTARSALPPGSTMAPAASSTASGSSSRRRRDGELLGERSGSAAPDPDLGALLAQMPASGSAAVAATSRASCRRRRAGRSRFGPRRCARQRRLHTIRVRAASGRRRARRADTPSRR